jgi:dolichol-phosphate mannosyltransferase
MPHSVIILPTYNEADTIGSLIEKLQSVFLHEKKYRFSILVVDDNSPDGTGDVVKKLSKKFANVHLLTGNKKGLGVAYVRGMHYAIDKMKADILFEMDSDLSHDPKIIPHFLRKIEEGYDVVVGSRYIKGGSIPQDWAFSRKLFSIAGNLIVRFGLMLPHVHEWSSGYRAIQKEVFESINPGLEKYAGYTFQIASLHRTIRNGFKVAEIPIQFIDRKYGKSKFVVTDYAPNVIKYVLYNSSFIRFGITGVIGFTINVIGLEVFYRFGFDPGIASAMGAEFAIVSNFLFNNYWTFSHKKIPTIRELPLKFLHFNLVAAGAVIIQGLVVGIGTHFFGDHTRFIFLVLAVIFFIIPYSYFMYNKFIWKNT